MINLLATQFVVLPISEDINDNTILKTNDGTFEN